MKTFLQLSPEARDIVLHLKSRKAEPGIELAITSLLLEGTQRGRRIRQTLAAIDECVEAGWIDRQLGAPDRVCLTPDGLGMLLFMP